MNFVCITNIVSVPFVDRLTFSLLYYTTRVVHPLQPFLPRSPRWHLAGTPDQRSTGRRGSCWKRRSQTRCPHSGHIVRCRVLSQRPGSRKRWVCRFPCTESWIYYSTLKFDCGLQGSRGEWLTRSNPETETQRCRESCDTYIHTYLHFTSWWLEC